MFGDGIEHILVSWFNMPYLRNSLKSGVLYVFRGRIKAKGARGLFWNSRRSFGRSSMRRLIGTMLPVYTLVKGLTNQMVTKAISQVLADTSGTSV